MFQNLDVPNGSLPKDMHAIWQYRLTDSDFFFRYQEEQKRLKDEYERQKAAQNSKLKPYRPDAKKATEREIKNLVSELDKEQTGSVNYSEFLKYSYLCAMYIYHLQLE